MSSWAEQYEKMKRERLALEEANKNKNVGFTQPVKVRSKREQHLELTVI